MLPPRPACSQTSPQCRSAGTRDVARSDPRGLVQSGHMRWPGDTLGALGGPQRSPSMRASLCRNTDLPAAGVAAAGFNGRQACLSKRLRSLLDRVRLRGRRCTRWEEPSAARMSSAAAKGPTMLTVTGRGDTGLVALLSATTTSSVTSWRAQTACRRRWSSELRKPTCNGRGGGSQGAGFSVRVRVCGGSMHSSTNAAVCSSVQQCAAVCSSGQQWAAVGSSVYPRPAHSVQRTFSRACVTFLVPKSRVTTEPGRGRELGLGDREPRPMIPNRRVVSTPRSADDSTCGTGVGLCWYTSCKQVEGGRAER